MRAAHQEIQLESVEVTVDSESDDRGILGADDSVPAGPLSTRVVVEHVLSVPIGNSFKPSWIGRWSIVR